MATPERLDYERVLYRGAFRFRSMPVLAVVVLFLMDLALGLVAVRFPLAMAPFPLVGVVVWVAFALMLALSGYVVYAVAFDARQVFTIGTDGICADGRRTPWSRVVRFGGYLGRGETVSLFFRTDTFGPPVRLMTTPPLTRVEFEQLIEVLRTEVSPNYPGVELGGCEPEVG